MNYKEKVKAIYIILYFSQSQAREVAALRTRNVELEGDVERLRRHLTNERFERSALCGSAVGC